MKILEIKDSNRENGGSFPMRLCEGALGIHYTALSHTSQEAQPRFASWIVAAIYICR